MEAGVWSADDAERLAVTGLGRRLTRILVEVVDAPADAAVAVADAIEAALDTNGLTAPRLIHGEDDACWPVLRHAFAVGRDTRIGLEDTLLLPDGSPANGNVDLMAAVNRLASGRLSTAPEVEDGGRPR